MQSLQPFIAKVTRGNFLNNSSHARTVEPTGLLAELRFGLNKMTHLGFQLHRMPYMASFRAGRFDFTIVSVHIYDSISKFKEREIQTLADAVYSLSRRQRYKVVDRDLFVVGDLNIKKDGDQFFQALKNHNFMVEDQAGPQNMSGVELMVQE